jgi:hypothetical protein
VDINPANIVKGQGLYKLLVESNYKFVYLNGLSTNIIEIESKEDETQEPSLEVSAKFSYSDWYKDIIFYLQNVFYS